MKVRISKGWYKAGHLQNYTGILTSHDTHSKFKMELKVEDNPVLERSIETIESSIELEFSYSMLFSTLFFHNLQTCPAAYIKDEQCRQCDDIKDEYHKFEGNLRQLQIGDTFKIEAAFIYHGHSKLPVRIQSFKDYEPLTVACMEDQLRLPDTPEGITKKLELEEQRLQREREEAQIRESEEENRLKEENKRKKQEKWDRFEEWLGKRKNIQKFLLGYLLGGITVIIPLILMIHKSCSTP